MVALPPGAASDTTLAASVRDTHTGDVALKLVNINPTDQAFTIDSHGFARLGSTATYTVLVGDTGAKNTLAAPGRVLSKAAP